MLTWIVFLSLLLNIFGTVGFCRLQLQKSELVTWFWKPYHLCIVDISAIGLAIAGALVIFPFPRNGGMALDTYPDSSH